MSSLISDTAAPFIKKREEIARQTDYYCNPLQLASSSATLIKSGRHMTRRVRLYSKKGNKVRGVMACYFVLFGIGTFLIRQHVPDCSCCRMKKVLKNLQNDAVCVRVELASANPFSFQPGGVHRCLTTVNASFVGWKGTRSHFRLVNIKPKWNESKKLNDYITTSIIRVIWWCIKMHTYSGVKTWL